MRKRTNTLNNDDHDDDLSFHGLFLMVDNPMLFPASKLGEYTVIGDIAEGTFGKVKSTSSSLRRSDPG